MQIKMQKLHVSVHKSNFRQKIREISDLFSSLSQECS